MTIPYEHEPAPAHVARAALERLSRRAHVAGDRAVLWSAGDAEALGTLRRYLARHLPELVGEGEPVTAGSDPG